MGDYSNFHYFYVKGEGIMKNFITAAYNLKKSLWLVSDEEQESVFNDDVCSRSFEVLREYTEKYMIHQKSWSSFDDAGISSNPECQNIWKNMRLLGLTEEYAMNLKSIEKHNTFLSFLKHDGVLYASNKLYLPEKDLIFQHDFKENTPKFLWDLCEKDDWNKDKIVKTFPELMTKYKTLKRKNYSFPRDIEELFEMCTLYEGLQDGIFYISVLDKPPMDYYND